MITTIENLPGEIWSLYDEVKVKRLINSHQSYLGFVEYKIIRYYISNLGRAKKASEYYPLEVTGLKKTINAGNTIEVLINQYSKGGNKPSRRYPCLPKGQYVHRLVAQAFIANPDNKLTVNHIDGDPNNNHVSNLEWSTYAENVQHAWATGLMDGRKGRGPNKKK